MLEKPDVTPRVSCTHWQLQADCGRHRFTLLVVGHPKLALRHYDPYHGWHRDCATSVRVGLPAFEIGVALSFTFFAAIAAGADIRAMISVAPLLIVLVLILLSVHLIVLLAVGRRLGLTIPELLTAVTQPSWVQRPHQPWRQQKAGMTK